MKKMIAILLALILSLSFGSLSGFAENGPGEGGRPGGGPGGGGGFFMKEPLQLPQFVQVKEITETEVYAYTPEALANAVATLTPVLIVFPDDLPVGEEAAMAYLKEKGLITFSDQEGAGIFLIRDAALLGEKGLSVYDQIISLFGSSGMSFSMGGAAKTDVGYSTYLSMVYAVGEGSGASFIQQYLTQHCDTLAAVLTVGGEMSEDTALGSPLAAYLANAGQKAIDYFRAVNETDVEKPLENGTEYFDLKDPVKRVVVAEEANELTEDIFLAGWNAVLRRTTRCAVYAPVWWKGYEAASANGGLKLQERPIPEDLGLVFNASCSDPEALPHAASWCEWIPEEALTEDNDAVYPLVMVYHGAGDDPQFEAESNGWVKIASDERLIVVSPSDNYASGITMMSAPGETSYNMDLVDYICQKYPVDESRIYVVGFSLGGVHANATAMAYMDRFAGVGIFTPAIGNALGMPWPPILNYEDSGVDAAALDLPVFYYSGTADDVTGVTLPSGECTLAVEVLQGVNRAFQLNEIHASIDTENLDYQQYPYFGADLAVAAQSFVNKHGLTVSEYSYADKNDVELVRLAFIEGSSHNHYTELSEYGWDFLRNFSRDPATHQLMFNGNPVE